MNYKAKHLNLNTQYFTLIHLRMIENLYILHKNKKISAKYKNNILI